jgi:hypothetical protein
MGHIRSFHASKKKRIARVARAGLARGTITRKNTPYSDAPSTRAASSSSWGMLEHDYRCVNVDTRSLSLSISEVRECNLSTKAAAE